jgi:hypothetical protein
VYRFYAQQALAADWTPHKNPTSGLTQSWTKRIDGSLVSMVLNANLSNRPGSFVLNAAGP